MPAAPECGLANGLPSVTVVTSSTCGQAWARPDDNRVCPGRPRSCQISRHAARFLPIALVHLVVAIGLVIVGGDAMAVEPAVGSAPESVGAPGLAGPQDDLLVRSTMLEREQRWADVVSLCETAARQGALAPELHQRYDLAKIHCDLSRRHCERAFRTQVVKLAETDARRLYAEVLGRIGSHHVDAPRFARLVERG